MFEELFMTWRYVYNKTLSEKNRIRTIPQVGGGGERIIFPKRKGLRGKNLKILVIITLEH